MTASCPRQHAPSVAAIRKIEIAAEPAGSIAAVEFSDVADHINCTTRQRSRSAAA